MKVEFTLNGMTPLLMHADDVLQADTLMEWRKDPANKNLSQPGDDRSPAWTWQTYLYHDGSNLVMPCENMMVCLRQAAAQIVMKRQKTFKESSQSGMFIDSENLDLTVKRKPVSMADIIKIRNKTFKEQFEAVKKLGFVLYVKRARVGQSKHIRVRARFDTWEVTGSLNVIAPELTKEVLRQMFEIAGRVGLCDWRPGCKTPGPYGMFEADMKFQ